VRPDDVRDLLSQLRPLGERVAVAGHELAPMTADMRERAEAIELRLENEVRMIERLGDTKEPHGGRRGMKRTCRSYQTDVITVRPGASTGM